MPMKSPLSEKVQQLLQDADSLNEIQFFRKLKDLIVADEIKRINIKEASSIAQLMDGNISKITSKNQSSILATGFKNLDEIAALSLGDFVVLGGRPGMGKTQIIVNICDYVSSTTPILYYTFDLSKLLLSSRFLSVASGISLDKITNQNLTESEIKILSETAQSYGKHEIFINETGSQSITAIRNQCEKYVKEKGVKLLVVDYMQLMSSRKYNHQRESEVSYISRELKNIARDLNICVIALSQLSRAVENRGGSKRPMLSDLRDSGAIEQDADKVIFVYRPEYYDITEDEDGNDARCVTELIIAKNRSGKIGKAHLRRDADFIKFYEYSDINEFTFGQHRLDELKN